MKMSHWHEFVVHSRTNCTILYNTTIWATRSLHDTVSSLRIKNLRLCWGGSVGVVVNAWFMVPSCECVSVATYFEVLRTWFVRFRERLSWRVSTAQGSDTSIMTTPHSVIVSLSRSLALALAFRWSVSGRSSFQCPSRGGRGRGRTVTSVWCKTLVVDERGLHASCHHISCCELGRLGRVAHIPNVPPRFHRMSANRDVREVVEQCAVQMKRIENGRPRQTHLRRAREVRPITKRNANTFR